ncbi:hypothetical protein [Flavimaricola marinus]|uniref:Uncharacterized protein n=1 Tax=Flavimaricola marinus TaxID=1819565 RepID=A0A238LF52_9RHOB|nr:hypothetical protein [Flavimaricola marinus]SMY08261.1 hypothetical protein LOM8899_02411 [Flavimaricola marinus]
MRYLLLAIFLIPGVAMADRILGEVTSDLNGDGTAETFILREFDEGYASLILVTESGAPVEFRAVAWSGMGAGNQPSLALAPNGSVQIISENAAIGRNRWTQTLTIAYRAGAYRVAGYTYSWYDTLDLEFAGTCDVNLLTGNGVLDQLGHKPKSISDPNLVAVPLGDWTMDSAVEACDPIATDS